MVKTVTMHANIGVNRGYFHHNGADCDFYTMLQQAADEVQRRTGIYVSCIAYKSKTIYRTDWGCPAGGEDTYNIESTAIPRFAPDAGEWKKAARELVLLMKEKLRQSVVTMQFFTSELEYMDGEPAE